MTTATQTERLQGEAKTPIPRAVWILSGITLLILARILWHSSDSWVREIFTILIAVLGAGIVAMLVTRWSMDFSWTAPEAVAILFASLSLFGPAFVWAMGTSLILVANGGHPLVGDLGAAFSLALAGAVLSFCLLFLALRHFFQGLEGVWRPVAIVQAASILSIGMSATLIPAGVLMPTDTGYRYVARSEMDLSQIVRYRSPTIVQRITAHDVSGLPEGWAASVTTHIVRPENLPADAWGTYLEFQWVREIPLSGPVVLDKDGDPKTAIEQWIMIQYPFVGAKAKVTYRPPAPKPIVWE